MVHGHRFALGCAAEAVIIAAAISSPDPFLIPHRNFCASAEEYRELAEATILYVQDVDRGRPVWGPFLTQGSPFRRRV